MRPALRAPSDGAIPGYGRSDSRATPGTARAAQRIGRAKAPKCQLTPEALFAGFRAWRGYLAPAATGAPVHRKVYKLPCVSLGSDTMTIRIHYRPVQEIRALPSRIRIIEPELDPTTPVDRYLGAIDQAISAAHPAPQYEGLFDIAATVFGNQQAQHETKTRHLAHLIYERLALGKRQLQDVDQSIEHLRGQIPLRPRGPGHYVDGTLNEAERLIFDLERQKRALELTLWRDTVELRTSVLTERVEQHALRRRLSVLGGGLYGDR
jgi:hypothetical protein